MKFVGNVIYILLGGMVLLFILGKCQEWDTPPDPVAEAARQATADWIELQSQMQLDTAIEQATANAATRQVEASLMTSTPALTSTSVAPAATLTAGLTSTATLTPVVSVTPTSTPTPAPLTCAIPVAAEFKTIWELHQTQAGCPTANLVVIPKHAEEIFQGGHLFWRSDTDEIWVIYDRDQNTQTALANGQWELRPERWDGTTQAPDLNPPTGMFQPQRGFGWLWYYYLGAQDSRLGWALAPEYGFDNTSLLQPLERGWLFRGSDPKRYLLFDTGAGEFTADQ